MLDLRFNIAGEDQYRRSFAAFGHEVQNLREPLGNIRDMFVRTTGANFASEGGNAGGWQPLNEAYDTWKQEAFPGRPMLVLTGDMRRAFLVDGTLELTDQKLVWGVDTQTDEEGRPIVERAYAHQTGQGRMPQRKIVSLTATDRREVDHEIVAYINRIRRGIFGGAL